MFPLCLYQQADAVRRDAQSLSGKAQLFLCGGFHADLFHRNTAGCCDLFPHGNDIRCKLWFLAEDRGIQIAHGIALCLYLFHHQFQQL